MCLYGTAAITRDSIIFTRLLHKMLFPTNNQYCELAVKLNGMPFYYNYLNNTLSSESARSYLTLETLTFDRKDFFVEAKIVFIMSHLKGHTGSL